MSRKGWLGILLLFALACSFAHAGEWDSERDQLTASCSDMFGGFAQAGKCAGFLFNSGAPLRLSIPQSVVPGGGVGVGLTFIQPIDITNWAGSNFTMDGGSSLNEFWFGDAALTLSHRKWGGQWNTSRDRFQMQIYSHARGLPLMPFYGIGPDTVRSNIADFGERRVSAGASVVNPVSSWLNVGGSIEYIKPQIRGVSGASVRSIDNYYSEATAPGLTHQPGFAHYSISAEPKCQWSRAKFNAEVAFHKYQDLDTGHYSFRKFRADFLQTIYPETQREPTGGGQYRTQPKYDSVLYIAGTFSASSASSNDVVPFYLQDTIGGRDIENIPTLRGFQDYRFRAPNLFSLQTQYERRLLPSPPPGSSRPSTIRSILGAVGIMAFYDIGEVATRVDDLSFSNVRHSVGFGLTFWSGEKVWFRAYIGLGSGEGTHTFVGITNPSTQNLHL